MDDKGRSLDEDDGFQKSTPAWRTESKNGKSKTFTDFCSTRYHFSESCHLVHSVGREPEYASRRATGFVALSTGLEGETARKMKNTNSEKELKEAFRVFEKDQDSFDSAAEIRAFLKKFGEKRTDEEVNEMIRKADVFADGQIDYDRFVKVMMANDHFGGRRKATSFGASSSGFSDSDSYTLSSVIGSKWKPSTNCPSSSSIHRGEPSSKGNNAKYKTRLCERFAQGRCKFGIICNFAHGEHELRAPVTIKNWSALKEVARSNAHKAYFSHDFDDVKERVRIAWVTSVDGPSFRKNLRPYNMCGTKMILAIVEHAALKLAKQDWVAIAKELRPFTSQTAFGEALIWQTARVRECKNRVKNVAGFFADCFGKGIIDFEVLGLLDIDVDAGPTKYRFMKVFLTALRIVIGFTSFKEAVKRYFVLGADAEKRSSIRRYLMQEKLANRQECDEFFDE